MISAQPALQEILFGTFVPPPVIDTRCHQFGLVGMPRYVSPQKTSNRDASGLSNSEKLVLEATKASEIPVSAVSMTKMVKMTKSHCGMVLCSLYKMGLLTRNKVRQNRTCVYVYSIKQRSGN